MRKFAPPQIIILLDFIFVFLLILITQKPAEIKINLPETEIRDIAFVMENKGEVSHFLNQGYWENLENFSNDNSIFSIGISDQSFFITTKCNSLCKDIQKPNIQGEMKILITGKLYSRISNTLLGACKHNSSACSNLEIDITEFGTINEKLLIEKNPIFEEIF